MKSPGPRLLDAAIVVVAMVVLMLFRLHAFGLPLETDEANYAYIGGRLLAGDKLYIDVWDHQPPGVFMLFAGAIALFGDAPPVFRWMATAFSATSLLLIFAILRRVSGRPAALLGVILFSVVSSDPGTCGEGVNREIYMNTLVLAAWWMALRGWADVCEIAPLIPRSASPPHFFHGPCGPGQRLLCTLLAGTSLGLASLLKTNMAVFWVFLCVWVAVRTWLFHPQARFRAVLLSVAVLGVGPLIIWALTIGYFAFTDRFDAFVEGVFLVNMDYAQIDEAFYHRFWAFFDPPRFDHIFDSGFPLWIGAAAALAWLLSTAILRPVSSVVQIAALVLAAYIAVCLPGRFWPHYYYLLIPPCVIALSVFVVSLLHASAQLLSRRKRTAAVAIVASGLLISVIGASQYTYYLQREGLEITMSRYNTRDYWGRAQGENVRRVTGPDDSVFVFGNDAAIYYYSGRRCASRFTMIMGLHPAIRGAKDRQRTLLQELRDNPPKIIIDIEKGFDGWSEFLLEHYVPIGADFHDLKPNSPIMVAFGRKGSAIESIDWNWDRSQVTPKAALMPAD